MTFWVLKYQNFPYFLLQLSDFFPKNMYKISRCKLQSKVVAGYDYGQIVSSLILLTFIHIEKFSTCTDLNIKKCTAEGAY
jgi:hypothetical protein